MKKFTKLFLTLFLFFTGSLVRAQVTPPPTASVCQPTDPSIYAPVAHDTIKIYLNFIFTKPTGTVVGIFDTIGPWSVGIICGFMNGILDSLYAPQLIATPAAPYIKKTWIKLIPKNVVHLANSTAYYNAGMTQIYPDNTAININYEITNGTVPAEGTAPIGGGEVYMIYPPPTNTNTPYTSLIDAWGAGV